MRRPLLLCPLLLCICLCLPACHLVDQRDVDAQAGRPPLPTPPSPGPPPIGALVTIRYTTPEPDWRTTVATLVTRAIARKRDVLFTVTTAVPPAADETAAAGSGREVAQAIVDDGAEPGQVEQAVRTDPALTLKEVRIDVH